MNDKLIYELKKHENLGNELVDKLNGDYIIEKFEIILDEIVDREKKLDEIVHVSTDFFDIMIFLSNFHNNIITYNVCPIYYKEHMNICKFLSYDRFGVGSIFYKYKFNLKITLKPIKNKYHFMLIPEIQYNEIYSGVNDKQENYKIYSNCFTNFNDFEMYLEQNNSSLLLKHFNNSDEKINLIKINNILIYDNNIDFEEIKTLCRKKYINENIN